MARHLLEFNRGLRCLLTQLEAWYPNAPEVRRSVARARGLLGADPTRLIGALGPELFDRQEQVYGPGFFAGVAVSEANETGPARAGWRLIVLFKEKVAGLPEAVQARQLALVQGLLDSYVDYKLADC